MLKRILQKGVGPLRPNSFAVCTVRMSAFTKDGPIWLDHVSTHIIGLLLLVVVRPTHCTSVSQWTRDVDKEEAARHRQPDPKQQYHLAPDKYPNLFVSSTEAKIITIELDSKATCVPGLSSAIQSMHAGERSKITIMPSMAYGSSGLLNEDCNTEISNTEEALKKCVRTIGESSCIYVDLTLLGFTKGRERFESVLCQVLKLEMFTQFILYEVGIWTTKSVFSSC